jgi:CSLREA domain-containing protein
MSSTHVLRALLVTLFCVAVLAFASFRLVNQQAASRSDHAVRRDVSTRLFLADKGGLTPEGNTIIVNSLSDVANGTDGLCTLREAITAANNDTASGATAGECAAGSSSGSDAIGSR